MLPAQPPAPKPTTFNEQPTRPRVLQLLRLRRLAAAALIVGLVAACSAQATEDAPTPVVTTPEPTPEASEPPEPAPTRPPEAKGKSVEAAEATLAYFLDVYNSMLQSGDIGAFEDITTANCRFCKVAIDETVDTQLPGGSWDGGKVHYESPWAVPEEVLGSRAIAYTFATVEPHKMVTSTGSVQERTQTTKLVIKADLVMSGSGWIVDSIEAEDMAE